VVNVALVVAAGIILGQQYVSPNKRVVPVIVGLLVSGLAWGVGIIAGLGVLIIALPFPHGTVFGNTNLALILLMLVIWLLRITQRQLPPPRGTSFDIPILGLLTMYMLSFYNVHSKTFLTAGLENFELVVGAVLMFYLIVNNMRTVADLERIQRFMIISATSIFLIAVYELNHPAAEFIHGWIDFSATVGSEFNTRNVRVGSMFHDFELLSEYCVMTMMMAIFLLMRARTLGQTLIYGSFLVLNGFVMFATVSRGAIVSLAVGVAYLLWITRRHLRFVPFTIVAVAAIAGFLTMNYFVANYTRSGDMFARLASTKVVQGWMPEDRAETWANAWGRAMVHPLIGSGPSYRELAGWQPWWPHNVYLYYANIIGFPGMLFFVWLMFKFLTLTRPKVDDLRHPDYAQAYLIICQVQVAMFVVNEFKIDYQRNNVYMFYVWVLFAVWAASARLAGAQSAARVPALDLSVPPVRRLRAVGQ
jgi:O-antigen ligase